MGQGFRAACFVNGALRSWAAAFMLQGRVEYWQQRPCDLQSLK